MEHGARGEAMGTWRGKERSLEEPGGGAEGATRAGGLEVTCRAVGGRLHTPGQAQARAQVPMR